MDPNDPIRLDGLPFSINPKRIFQLVGLIAILLSPLLWSLAKVSNICEMSSISHYYYTRIGGDLFVGALCFIGLNLLIAFSFNGKNIDGYLGFTRLDDWLLRIAGLCALLIAFVPTAGSGCNYTGETARSFLLATTGAQDFNVPGDTMAGTISHDFWASFQTLPSAQNLPFYIAELHILAAGGMFLILAYFCIFVFTRPQSRDMQAKASDDPVKRSRNRFYRVCGYGILLCILGLIVKFIALRLLDDLGDQDFLTWWNSFGGGLTFWLEAFALTFFGAAWMLKGRFLGLLDDH